VNRKCAQFPAAHSAWVRYQDSPKDGKECDARKLFMPPNACKSVARIIEGMVRAVGKKRLMAALSE
jgi:hypothetical protein